MSDASIQTRLADESDQPAIQVCVEDAYQPYAERMTTPPAPVLDDYADLIARKVVHVATQQNSLVGLIVMWPEEDHLYVDNIAVLPEAQGLGVAGVLLQLAEDQAREATLPELRLYTNEAMTENVGFYGRKGFIETHREVDAGYRRIYFARALSGT